MNSKKLQLFQVDAFASELFGGNPAAVCPLGEWLDESLMQQIALENNLSETAFFVPKKNGFDLRWFTPAAEVKLCGHATLASAHVLFEHLGYDQDAISFFTLSGELIVKKTGDGLVMDFPAVMSEVEPMSEELVKTLGRQPAQVLKSDDYLVVYEKQSDVEDFSPDYLRLSKLDCRGIIVTARGDEVDFVSRFFAPKYGINEDPVTGSAHCKLTPYWVAQLDKTKLTARQLSKRGGELQCEKIDDRVLLTGQAVTYMIGEIMLPNEAS